MTSQIVTHKTIKHIHTTHRLLTSPITTVNTNVFKSTRSPVAGSGWKVWYSIVIGLVFIFFVIFLIFCVYRCKKKNIIYTNIEMGQINSGVGIEESLM